MQKLLSFTSVIFVFSACMQHEADLSGYDCSNQPNLSYSVDIQPIINNSCATSSCHDASNPADKLDLSSYEKVKDHIQHAKFWGALEHNTKYEPMPKGASKLSDTLILKIACWAKNGTPQ